MSKLSTASAWVLVGAFALLLVSGGAVSAAALNDTCEGKVVSYEKAKCLTIECGAEKKEIKLDDKTVVEGEVAAGVKVKVEAKDGVAVKVCVVK
jgi:hypothetical protein